MLGFYLFLEFLIYCSFSSIFFEYKLWFFFAIIEIQLGIAIFYIPIQIIRCWCKIINNYKNNNPQDEEEKKIRDKNYHHLICFAATQIITFILTICVLILIQIKLKNNNFLYIYCSSLINSVTHYFFLFYFVYDEDSINSFKQIMKCKKQKKESEEDLLISTVILNNK